MPVSDRVLPVSDADVQAAAELLEPVIRRTPVVRSRALSDLLGGPVYLKCENQQRAGSFKIRGAYTRMARLSEEEKARGVVAASAGNHAQGVALAARLLGVPARVYMPVGAPLPKLDATRGYGAEVVLTGSTVDECLASALAWAESSGAVMIHPFDHPDVVAGQGTIALELLEQQPDVKTVLVSTGGGGLLAGVATVLKARRPDIRVIGVQAASAAAYPPSLAAGKPESLPSMSTMADGIAVGRPGDVPFAIVQSLVDDLVTVDEETISRALLLMLERQKLLIEPAGAVAVAALLKDGLEVETPALAVLSGGNVDPLLLMRLIRHGLASAGRYLRMQVRVADTPGSLAQLLMHLATTGANVMEVEHVRTGARTAVNEVEVALWVETRGRALCGQVVQDLVAAGYQITATESE
jgi:threonine dehydratase